MVDSYFVRVQKSTPTRFWINNVTRGQAQAAIDHGAVGCTQNPSYAWKILDGSEDSAYADELARKAVGSFEADGDALMWLQRELVRNIAEAFLPMYESSSGANGYVSIQGDPFIEDGDSIVAFARHNREAGPNVMAKIPATKGGLEAIEILARERVPLNATECMTVRQVIDVCETYERATRGLADPAPLVFSLITGIFDEYLQQTVAARAIDVDPDALWQAGIAVAKKTAALVKDRGYRAGFVSGGARALHHFTEMVGADANITINWTGTADRLIEQNPPVVQRFLQPTPYAVEDELLEKLEDFRKAYLLDGIEPEDYADFGPVVLFRSSFEKAWESALRYLGDIRQH